MWDKLKRDYLSGSPHELISFFLIIYAFYP